MRRVLKFKKNTLHTIEFWKKKSRTLSNFNMSTGVYSQNEIKSKRVERMREVSVTPKTGAEIRKHIDIYA